MYGVTVKSTVLVVTTERWFSTARLVMGLANAGFRMEAVCPVHHPLAKTSAVPQPYRYVQHAALNSLTAAIAATKPDLIVPADDVATHDLHRLHDRERHRGKTGEPICALIERSLGAPKSFPAVERRAATLQLAATAGVRVPETKVVTSSMDLEKWLTRFGPSVVLKADSTSGGTGVRIAHTLEDAKRAFRELRTATPSSRLSIPKLPWAGEPFAWPRVFRDRSIDNAQVFVAG